MTMKTETVKTPRTPKPMNRKARRELKFAAHALENKRTLTDATIKKTAKTVGIEIADLNEASTKTAESAEGMIFGSLLSGNLNGLLSGVLMLRQAMETSLQWLPRQHKTTGRLGRAGIAVDHVAIGKIADKKVMLETLWISVIGELWEADAKTVATSALDRTDLAGSALVAWRLGVNTDVIDALFGTAWRADLEKNGITI